MNLLNRSSLPSIRRLDRRRKTKIREMSLNHLGVQVTISNQNRALTIQTVFPTLMVSSNFSTKVTIWSCSWFETISILTEDGLHFTETASNFARPWKWYAMKPTQVLAIKSVISFIFYTGNVRMKLIRDPRQIGAWMDKDGKIEKFDKVLFANLLTLLGTSVTLKSSITRDNSTLS